MNQRTDMDPADWREAHAAYTEDFKKSAKTYSDEVMLRIRLRRLGFEGVRLDEEISYLKGL